jgi:hypothetical protein
MLTDCLILIHLYIVWRGAWLVFWEAFGAISHMYDKWTGASPSKPIKVTYKMYSVNAVFKYLFRLLRLDFGEETPMVLIEGTYAPKRSFIKIHGPMCENRRRDIQDVVEQYLCLHHTPRHSPGSR